MGDQDQDQVACHEFAVHTPEAMHLCRFSLRSYLSSVAMNMPNQALKVSQFTPVATPSPEQGNHSVIDVDDVAVSILEVGLSTRANVAT